jgi:uncharacterized protein (DUF1778 family)
MYFILHNKCSYVHVEHFLVCYEKTLCQEEEYVVSRLSIEVTPEQHQRLKAIAALSGMTIKEYVLERVLPPVPEQEELSEAAALHQLETLLQPRIEAARRGEVVNVSVEQIFADVRQESRP